MVHNNSDKLIYCHSDFGPVFGSGCDLAIGDNCNADKGSSWACFPFSYNYEGPNKYAENCQDSLKAFSGAIEGHKFKVIEYEVYHVIY